MSRSFAKSIAVTVVVTIAIALAGCGGITTFQGKSAMAVMGTPPPPPPPPPPPQRVEVTAEKININEKIQFGSGMSVIKKESFSLLDEVAKVMNANPQIKKIEIQGHASPEGGPAYNMALSDARAKAVKAYLLAHGVAADKLTAKGYGLTKPIGDNTTEAGRELNRRVEFVITEQEAKQP